MGRGRKAIHPNVKDNDAYHDKGAIDRQKETVPDVDSAKLIAPKWLTKEAKQEWKRVVKLYRTLEVNILNDLDQAVLTSYVIEVDIRNKLYQEWAREQKLICEDTTNSARSTFAGRSSIPSESSVGEKKRKVVNPILREINKHDATIRVLAEQLCLTPAGRAAYAVRQEKANQSAAEAFMEDD